MSYHLHAQNADLVLLLVSHLRAQGIPSLKMRREMHSIQSGMPKSELCIPACPQRDREGGWVEAEERAQTDKRECSRCRPQKKGRGHECYCRNPPLPSNGMQHQHVPPRCTSQPYQFRGRISHTWLDGTRGSPHQYQRRQPSQHRLLWMPGLKIGSGSPFTSCCT